jgi:hypothetical protein
LEFFATFALGSCARRVELHMTLIATAASMGSGRRVAGFILRGLCIGVNSALFRVLSAG